MSSIIHFKKTFNSAKNISQVFQKVKADIYVKTKRMFDINTDNEFRKIANNITNVVFNTEVRNNFESIIPKTFYDFNAYVTQIISNEILMYVEKNDIFPASETLEPKKPTKEIGSNSGSTLCVCDLTNIESNITVNKSIKINKVEFQHQYYNINSYNNVIKYDLIPEKNDESPIIISEQKTVHLTMGVYTFDEFVHEIRGKMEDYLEVSEHLGNLKISVKPGFNVLFTESLFSKFFPIKMLSKDSYLFNMFRFKRTFDYLGNLSVTINTTTFLSTGDIQTKPVSLCKKIRVTPNKINNLDLDLTWTVEDKTIIDSVSLTIDNVLVQYNISMTYI